MLAKALLAEGRRRFAGQEASWRSLALFRSLNMAHSAAQIPGVVGVTNQSLGRNIGLWVSAFEILVHPETDESGVKRVYALLDQVYYRTQACKDKSYFCYEGRNGKKKGQPQQPRLLDLRRGQSCSNRLPSRQSA